MSSTSKPYEQVARERRASIVARKPMAPTGACLFCGVRVPKGALWCAAACAKDYEEEKRQVLGE